MHRDLWCFKVVMNQRAMGGGSIKRGFERCVVVIILINHVVGFGKTILNCMFVSGCELGVYSFLVLLQ